jgi:hypothetical protein
MHPYPFAPGPTRCIVGTLSAGWLVSAQAVSVTFEAESGSLGANFAYGDSPVSLRPAHVALAAGGAGQSPPLLRQRRRPAPQPCRLSTHSQRYQSQPVLTLSQWEETGL